MHTLETSGRVMTGADLGLPLGYYGYIHSAWTPCWSAHYYGFPVWRDDCSCTEERKATLRAEGISYLEKRGSA